MNKHFNLDLITDLPKIKRVNIDGKRHYMRECGAIVQPYPSVTTVVSSCRKSQKALHEWRARVGSEEANKVSRRAAGQGNAVHNMIEHYVQNQTYTKNVMPFHQDMFSRLKKVADDHIDNIRMIETQMISDHLQTAGTVDLVAEYDGRLSIIDWKTSKRTKQRAWVEGYFKQESAYAVMVEENTGIPIDQLVTIVTVETGETQVFIEKRDSWIDKFKELRADYKVRYESRIQDMP